MDPGVEIIQQRQGSPDVPSITGQKTSMTSVSQSDFTVIWHNLTYKADSSRWYTSIKDCLVGSGSDQLSNNDDTEIGQLSSRPAQSNFREKIILNQICGEAKSRQLTAIMGPSGAGKSTLLHCLFQNRSAGTTGRILVESKSKSKLKVCFIPQHDHLNEWLTVREDLIFVSKLKLARVTGLFKDQSSSSFLSEQASTVNSFVRQSGEESCTSLIDHEANALCVADLLDLNSCLDVTIKRISGGQKKRLSIARELMSKPDILVLDEPTTGLDSLNCYKTVMVLRDLAKLSPNPMAVIMTIHQPQREVFNLFDKTYFLSKSSGVIFDGNPKNALATIESVSNLKLPVPKYNPANFLIEIASHDSHSIAREQLSAHQRRQFYENYGLDRLKRLMQPRSGSVVNQNWKFCTVEQRCSIYSTESAFDQAKEDNKLSGSDSGHQRVSTVTKEISKNGNQMVEDPYFGTNDYYISRQLRDCLSSHSNNLLQSFRHVFILTHRSWLSVMRNPTFTKSRLIFHTLLPLMMVLVFGRSIGVPNNCPKFESELNIQDMTRDIDSGVVAQNVEDTRLTLENMSFFFILMYGFGINIISCTASFYPTTMHMFKKETINGLYSATPYYIGQMLAELPLEIFFPSLSIVMAYPLTGQLSSFLQWRMFAVAYLVFLVSYSIHSLGLLCGSIFVNNVNVAVLLGQGSLLPFVMFSGFLIRPSRMSEWMRKLTYISPFKHGLGAILAARYGFGVCDCDDDMIPEGDGKVAISGMTPNIKHVLQYMFPKGNSTDSLGDLEVTEIFDKLGERFVKAQTFDIDIKSCADVRPNLMNLIHVKDTDLFIGIGCLLLFITIFKLITFSIIKTFPYRRA